MGKRGEVRLVSGKGGAINPLTVRVKGGVDLKRRLPACSFGFACWSVDRPTVGGDWGRGIGSLSERFRARMGAR